MSTALPGKLLVAILAGPGDAAATAAAFTQACVPALEVRTLVLRGAGGMAEANAEAGAHADYLAFVPAGTVWPAGHLEACIGALRHDVSVGMAGAPAAATPPGLELFVPLAGAVVRHSAFHAVEGFHPELDALVDVDLGWRLWLRGFRVTAVGEPLAGEAVAIPADPEAAIRLVLARVLDETSLVGAEWSTPAAATARRAAAGRRIVIQRQRARGDGELVPLAHRSMRRWATADPVATSIVDELVRWGAPDRAGSRRRIAVVTADTLAPRMAGPGIRALQVARRLAQDHDVVLATTERCELEGDGFEARYASERGLRELEAWCDVFFFQGWILAGRDFLVDTDKVVVADIYDPMHLEQLEQGHDAEGERGRYEAVRSAVFVLNEQLARGDFFLCASLKQRDLWLGQLAGLGRVNPVLYEGDESLRSLLAVVPFGVGDEPPVQTRHAIKGEVPGIAASDQVIIWGGGVYNWFDPLTLIRAVDRLRHRLPTVRLFFLGMRHPNPGVPEMRMVADTQALADELGLEGSHVFFNRDWVAFEDRQNYLLDADVAVSTHLDHIETEFSFRTRILDYLWAGLPIVATGGDSFADVISGQGLGVVVPPNDVEALEQSLEALLTDPARAATCRENIAALVPAMRWEPVLQPLVDFCRDPRRAPDAACPDLRPPSEVTPLQRGWRNDVAVAKEYLRAGAGRLLVQRAAGKVRRVLRR